MLYIFDWDGTLIDSTAKIVSCLQSAIDELDMEIRSVGELREIIGLGLFEAVAHLFPGISDSDNRLLGESYSRHFITADQRPCALYPNVEETLAQLRSDGHLLAVATGKSRRGLNRVLGNLAWRDYFDSSRCADETRSKPHPLMLEEILQELSVDACDALMVGDTEFDLQMARHASVPAIGVSYGAHARSRLLQHTDHDNQAVAIIDDISELLSRPGRGQGTSG